jgi:hypothetical protein
MEEINERLQQLDYSPIAPRTFEHYRRLARRGFRRYVTINRLDTMELPDPFEDESIRSRYAYQAANVPTQLVVNMSDAPVEVVGVADSLSDFGTEVLVTDKRQVTALRATPPPAGTTVTVHFLEPSATVYGRIDFVSSLEPDEVRIDVLFQRLIPVAELTGGESLATDVVRFTIGDADEPSLDLVSRDLYWLLQAIEASRGVVNLVLVSVADGLVAPATTVDRLTVASPLDAWLRLSIHVYSLVDQFLGLASRAGDVLRSATDASTARPIRRAQAGVLDAQADLVAAQADNIRAQTEGLRLDNRRKDLLVDLVAETTATLINDLQSQGREVNEHPALNTERLATLLFDLERSAKELESRGLSTEGPLDGPDEENGP